MNRKERRAAERRAIVDAIKAEEFTRKMRAGKEAKLALKLYLERQVKLVALPDEHARQLAQQAVDRMREARSRSDRNRQQRRAT